MFDRTYRVQPYEIGGHVYQIRYVTDPGSLEGEPIFTEWFQQVAMDTGADETLYYPGDGDVSSDWIAGPFKLTDIDGPDMAKLTKDELDVFVRIWGATLSYSDQGFLHLDMWNTLKGYHEALDQARSEGFEG